MPEFLLTLLAAVSSLALLGCFVLLVKNHRQRARIRQMEQRLGSIEQSLGALCSGTSGVDERVARLERMSRDLEHRQGTIEAQQQGERPYGEAIQLVHQGATAERLMEELGLSRSEADLVAMLHGMKQVG